MYHDLTKGNISRSLLLFALPMMAGNLLQQFYISAGVVYLRVEGAFYCGIGCLFLLYGYYRAIKKAGMSVVLTILSLGTRVLLAYILSATAIGVVGIWMAIPIGGASQMPLALFECARLFLMIQKRTDQNRNWNA